MDCIKCKQTKHSTKNATRSNELLKIIHTDICGPFDVSTFGGEKYLITFIDDFFFRVMDLFIARKISGTVIL